MSFGRTTRLFYPLIAACPKNLQSFPVVFLNLLCNNLLAMFTTVSALLSRLPRFQDSDAWEVFDRRYSPMLTGFFRSYGLGLETARDLAQETIHRAADAIKEGAYDRRKGRLRDWISGIARNVLRGQFRHAARESAHIAPKGSVQSSESDPSTEAAIASVEARFDRIWVRARLSALLRLAAESF